MHVNNTGQYTSDGQSGAGSRLFNVRPGEGRAVLFSCGVSFCVLGSYYLLKPLREAIGAGEARNLQWLWTGTFVAMLVAAPIYSAVASRLTRQQLLTALFRFFAVNLLLFFAAVHGLPESTHDWIDRVFYVWISVFNLFAITSFWGFMADIWRNHQAKRLFGLIAVGGTFGAILGSLATANVPKSWSVFWLFIVAAVIVEVGVWFVRALDRITSARNERPIQSTAVADAPIGGNIITGIGVVFRSPYLIAICIYLLLYTAMSTVMYFEQSHIVGNAIDERVDQTRLFAIINLIVNTLTLLTQAFLVGRIIKTIGVGWTLTLVPLLCIVGFAALGVIQLTPDIADRNVFGLSALLLVLVVFQIFRQAGNYAIGKPAREVLFTLISREQKYKSKAFIDTAVYRGGDVGFGWIFNTLLNVLGLSLGAIALATAPLAAVWLGVGLVLGWHHNKRAAKAVIDQSTAHRRKHDRSHRHLNQARSPQRVSRPSSQSAMDCSDRSS